MLHNSNTYGTHNDMGVPLNMSGYPNTSQLQHNPTKMNIPHYSLQSNIPTPPLNMSTNGYPNFYHPHFIREQNIGHPLNYTTHHLSNPDYSFNNYMSRDNTDLTVRRSVELNIPNIELDTVKQYGMDFERNLFQRYTSLPENYSEKFQPKHDMEIKPDIINDFTSETSTKDNEIIKDSSELLCPTDILEGDGSQVENVPLVNDEQMKQIESFVPAIDKSNLDIVKENQCGIKREPFTRDPSGFTLNHFTKYYETGLFTMVPRSECVREAYNQIKLGHASDRTKQNRMYECGQCELLFRHPKRFLIHLKWHQYGLTNVKREQEELEKEQRRLDKKRLVQEKRAEEIENAEFSCEMCNETYNTRKKLRVHTARVHSTTEPKECPVCHKKFGNAGYLRNHMTSHSNEKKFMCEECPKTFKFLHSLLRHQPTHKEKTYHCTQCAKSFGSAQLLHIHNKTHEKVLKGQSFHCSYCGKGFYHSYNLGVHERTHRGERPYTCHICHSTYATNSSLKRHLKVSHSTVKPFECQTCHRCFSTEKIRDRHALRAHTNPEDLKHPCGSCTSRFLTEQDLLNHLKQDHCKTRRRKRNKMHFLLDGSAPDT